MSAIWRTNFEARLTSKAPQSGSTSALAARNDTGRKKSGEILLWLAKKTGYRLIDLPTMTNGNNAESPLSSVYFIHNPKATDSILPKTF